MKIYKKSKEIFLIISILTLLLAFGCLYYKLSALGNFMLGLFASAVIVYIQSYINYKIELSRILIPILKEIDSAIFELQYFYSDSLESKIHFYPSDFYELKDNFEKLGTAICTLSDTNYLDKKMQKLVQNLSEETKRLTKEIFLIFKYYDRVDKTEKKCLFIELYNKLKKFNFITFEKNLNQLADRVNFKEYLTRSSFEKYKNFTNDIEMEESKSIYMAYIKEHTLIEYKALEKKFDLADDINKDINKKNKNNI